MRSRVIAKCREWFGYYYEKIMEWLHSISYRTIPASETRSNLTEEYVIHEQYAGEPYVRDFLETRTLKAVTNKYCIKIRTIQTNEDNNKENTVIIGKVRLLRKRNIIDEATLVIKKGEHNLIYWDFNK